MESPAAPPQPEHPGDTIIPYGTILGVVRRLHQLKQEVVAQVSRVERARLSRIEMLRVTPRDDEVLRIIRALALLTKGGIVAAGNGTGPNGGTGR